MRIPRRGNIRSHRARRRKIVAPWIVATTVTVVIVAAVSTGFYILVRSTCSGDLTATVVAAPNTASLLESIARGWADTQPAVGGKCARVDIEARDSASTVEALGQRWNTKASGQPPDAWVPESTAWVRRAAGNPVVGRMLPPKPPIVANSATVIAMPRPMAERLGWPKTPLTWQTLVTDLAAAPDGWGRYGKPEWGPVKLGMSDPAKSTAGLLALLALAEIDGTGRPSDAGRAAIGRLRQVQTVYRPSTDDIINELNNADRQGAEAALQYVSAFPALETDVFGYNQTDPVVPLVAVYPTDGSSDADNPYLVLQAPWSSQDRQQVVTEFLKYLRSGEARSTFRGAGFRGPDRAGKDLTPENGFVAKVPTRARVAPPAEAVDQALAAWGT